MGFFDWLRGAPVSTADYYQHYEGEGRQAAEDAQMSQSGYAMCTPHRGCPPTGRHDCGRVPLNYSQPLAAREETVYSEPRYRLPKYERPDYSSPDPRPLSQMAKPATSDGDALVRGLFGGVAARRQAKRYENKP